MLPVGGEPPAAANSLPRASKSASQSTVSSAWDASATWLPPPATEAPWRCWLTSPVPATVAALRNCRSDNASQASLPPLAEQASSRATAPSTPANAATAISDVGCCAAATPAAMLTRHAASDTV
eukprot:CAMPEP_0115379390 /NCGR_PEP_ID=MMETSP0271-20121206/4507_1 /TAXON_ID=71861 /ORGANISM="Scrippsiella trochoidea, Strain CCMP3099" /LENGTH=123 /DNA_ID=CAMNT_0002802591 /DNA_START=372 /DNA_END=739 /DNA_ORIENTATION=-